MDEYEKYDNGELLRERYLKVADISEGSYGLVSAAKDTANGNRLVAVKFIYPVDYKKHKNKASRPSSSPAKLRSSVDSKSDSLVPSKESILKSLYEEAQKEIKIHQILGIHPNISTLYDTFDSCLVLEYCSRGDLYEAIQNNKGPSTSQDIKDVFLQILNALNFCHSHQVYHRDLKPENILVADDWSIKLCDWGLATTTKIISNKDEFDIGSERYMAPELFDAEIESYDASKIDLWSIGIILLTLVFHKNPFQVANYSDKRFAQFVNNREALFDIFSTMSGDMFSVLRYCLNIDPQNRDLESLKSEVEKLKYFTMDEEYWGSDYEEEEEVEDEFIDFEDDFFFKKDQNLSISPVKRPVVIPSTAFDNIRVSAEEKPMVSSPSNTEGESIDSRMFRDDVLKDEILVPHNHRADALLSSNTNLKPIPISGMKFARNNRKPFNLASFNQSSHTNGRVSFNKFNREDFFTPKSVFNHYMDKYGEQKQGNALNLNIKHHHHHHHHNSSNTPDWKRNGRNGRSWKKNYKKNKQPNRNGRPYQNGEHSHGQLNEHTYVGNRRKSRLYSLSKTGKPINTLGNSLTNPHFQLAHSNAAHLGVCGSSTGKYIPPYLRSPIYTKSPVIEPLTEELDNMTLNNDYDEVFHLEDDFELGGPHSKDEGSIAQDSFKKQGFRSNTGTPDSIFNDYNGAKSAHRNIVTESTPLGSGRRHSTATPMIKRPISVGTSIGLENTSLLSSSVNSAGVKYVPPFRRGSQPSNMYAKAKPTERKPTEDSFINGKLVSYPLSELNNFAPNSVPSGGDWFSFKKDWSDYD